MPYLFEHSKIEINSLDALAKQLKMLEDQPGCQVIRGQLIEGRENQAIRRTSRYRGSQEANFESCTRPWCLIDIDDISLPLRFSDYQNKQELRFSKVENYLKSDSETNTEGAIEKLNRIDNKLTILEKDIVKRSATFGAGFAGLVFVIRWIVGKIMI